MKKIYYHSIIFVLLGLLGFSMLQGCGDSAITKKLKENEAKIIGIVTDVEAQTPIPKVSIEIKNKTTGKMQKTSTNSLGQFAFICEPGYYAFNASKEGYSKYTKELVIGKGENREDFYLSKVVISQCEMEGKVVNYITKEKITGATVQVGRSITHSDMDGNYKFEKKLPEGNYDCFISAPGYQLLEKKITLSKGMNRARFELLPFDPAEQVGGNDNEKNFERNPISAIDSGYLDDCKVIVKKTLKPSNEELYYEIVVENRYTSTLYTKEPGFVGHIIVSQNGCYEKVNQQKWVKVLQSEVLQPTDIYRADVESLLYYFNFVDPNVTIEEQGKETVEGYPCTKYHIYSDGSQDGTEAFDMYAWIIKDPTYETRLLNCLVRIQGTVPKNPDGEWYEIDITYSNIGNGNKIEIPKNLPAN